jgi:hypothetical protein
VTRRNSAPPHRPIHAAAHWLTVINTKALLDLEENGRYNWLIGMKDYITSKNITVWDVTA